MNDLIEELRVRVKRRRCRNVKVFSQIGPCSQAMANKALSFWCDPCADAELMRRAIERLEQTERIRLVWTRVLGRVARDIGWFIGWAKGGDDAPTPTYALERAEATIAALAEAADIELEEPSEEDPCTPSSTR